MEKESKFKVVIEIEPGRGIREVKVVGNYKTHPASIGFYNRIYPAVRRLHEVVRNLDAMDIQST